MGKYDNIILALLLAGILSLIVSVFSINFFFMKELLLLALLVIFAIGIFYGIAVKKKWVHAYAMLFFVIGIINGFFMYFMTNALLTYLLLAVNILGFIIVLQTVGVPRKGPEIIIKEVKDKEAKTKRAEKATRPGKKAKLSSRELLRTEEEILKQIGRAGKRPGAVKARPARGRLSEYYDEEDNTVVSPKEIDEFVGALNKYEKEVRKAKRPKKARKRKR